MNDKELRARISQLEFEVTSKSFELEIADKEIERLSKRASDLESMLTEWYNFDFDCPDDYDEEDEYQYDGWALELLYEKTSELLRK